MSKVQQFLDELTDNELLGFFHFRYSEFLQGSKDKIDAEIQKRRLNVEAFDPSVARSDHSDEKNCPRCGSSKFYNSTEIETITYSYASVDIKTDYKTCLVCLYCEEKDVGFNGNRNVSGFGFIRALINRRK